MYSLVIPVYRNADSIPLLIDSLSAVDSCILSKLEIIFVDDGSPDHSSLLIEELSPKLSCSIVLVRHSKNFGSFAAIRTGLSRARGVIIATMAADLQEPPSLFVELIHSLEEANADIAIATRRSRKDPFLTKVASFVFWYLYRRMVITEMPRGGVDCFACTSRVRSQLLMINEPNTSLIAQLFWVGFRRVEVPYDRLQRQHGTSAWGFRKKLIYMVDSIVAFSDLPLILIILSGLFGVVVGLAMTVVTLMAKFMGFISVSGYPSLILIQILFGSLILLAQGICGLYLWRTYENTKRRPLGIVQNISRLN